MFKKQIAALCFVATLFISSCTTLTPVQKQDLAVVNQHLWVEKQADAGKNHFFLDNNFYDSAYFFNAAIFYNGYNSVYSDYKYSYMNGDFTSLIDYSTYKETPDNLDVTYHLKNGLIFKIEMPLENFVYMSDIECNLGNIMAANNWTVVPAKTVCFGFRNCEAALASTGGGGGLNFLATDWGRVSDALKNCREQNDPHKNNWYLNFKKYITHSNSSSQQAQNFVLNMITDGYAGNITILKAPENAVKEIQENALKVKDIIIPVNFRNLGDGAYKLILNPENRLLISIFDYEIHKNKIQ